MGYNKKESRYVCKILFKEVKILPNKQISVKRALRLIILIYTLIIINMYRGEMTRCKCGGGCVTPAHKRGGDGILVRACARDGRCHSFSEMESWGLLPIKRRFCVVQQKERNNKLL